MIENVNDVYHYRISIFFQLSNYETVVRFSQIWVCGVLFSVFVPIGVYPSDFF